MIVEKKLIRGSLILLVMFNVFNFLNFAFQFSMARLLSVVDYGVLATIFTVVYITGAFSESIQLVITKYVSNLNSDSQTKNVLKRSFKKLFLFSVLFFVGYLVLAVFIAPIVEIPYTLIAINGLIIFFALLIPITRGIMQGRKRFFALGGNMIVESAAKLVISVLLVLVGFGLYGAIGGIVAGSLLALAFSFLPLKRIIIAREEHVNLSGFYQYSIPVAVFIVCIILFYSIDIWIAKSLFDAETAGAYAIAAVLSKIIFWGTQPVSKAMFPLSASNENKKKHGLLLNSIVIVGFLSMCALTVFYFFPDLIVHIFTGKDIAASVSILFNLGIAMTLLSFANLFFLYKLSRDRMSSNLAYSGLVFLVLPVLIEPFVLFYFRSSLSTFSLGMILSAAIFLLVSIASLKSK